MHHPIENAPLPGAHTPWALFLDVDGTLLAFHDDPGAVRASPSLKTTLASLHQTLGGAVALVSGRSLSDLDRLFGPPLVAVAGLHGLQRRRADASTDHIAPLTDQIRALHQHVSMLAMRMPRLLVEDKHVCVALHCRTAPELERDMIAAATNIAAQLPGYETQPGNCSIEIKPAGMDKGRALTAFLAEAPFAGRTPVYVGDDLTDEHAFAAANAHDGISIRVGDREPTQARFTLRDPSAVAVWLVNLLARVTPTT